MPQQNRDKSRIHSSFRGSKQAHRDMWRYIDGFPFSLFDSVLHSTIEASRMVRRSCSRGRSSGMRMYLPTTPPQVALNLTQSSPRQGARRVVRFPHFLRMPTYASAKLSNACCGRLEPRSTTEALPLSGRRAWRSLNHAKTEKELY